MHPLIERHSPSEQSMIDEVREYCAKMMHVTVNSNVVADYFSRPPDPVTAICSFFTSTPLVRFKVEMLAAAQDASADLLEGDDREVLVARRSLLTGTALLSGTDGSRSVNFQTHSATASARSSVCNVPRPSRHRTRPSKS